LEHAPGLPEAERHGFDLGLMTLSSALALGGVALAWKIYGGAKRPDPPRAGWLQPLYQLSLHKFYIDELLWVAVVAPLRGLSLAAAWADQHFVDRTVDLVGAIPRWIGAAPRLLHEGVIPSYALMMWTGLLFCLLAATSALW
jgi:NADH-quinone oxidoreductase subunit L